MAFTGFNFRASRAGGTNLPSDSTNATVILGDSSFVYSAAVGWGYKNLTSVAAADKSNPVDARIGGWVQINSTYGGFQIDLANGQYDIRVAIGAGNAGTQGVRITDGAYDSGRNYDVGSGGVAVPGGSELTASGSVVTDANWAADTSVVRVTVTTGFITICPVPGAGMSLGHVAYQAVSAPLQATRLDTDDTTSVINTTGTTTAGSASVTAVPSAVGILAGMSVSGPAIPVGTTVLATAPTGNTNATTSLTLSSGTNVLASTGGALRFGWPVTLYEKSPPGKLIAPITYVNGPPVFTVTLSDGLTPNPYLTVRTYAGQRWLAYTSTPFPGTSPLHTFCIVQTDATGTFGGSPFVTTMTLPVVYAPDKPTDGVSLLSRISTGAFLLRKNILGVVNSLRWPGYRGQTILPANDVLATSLPDLYAKMTTFAASAGNGTWFRIRLAASGSWATSYSSQGTTWNFKPEQGGGCLVEPDTTTPLISGYIYTGDQRGVHYRGAKLTFAGPTSASFYTFRIGHVTGAPLSVLMFTGNFFGFLHDPSNNPALVDRNAAMSMPAVAISVADQVTFINNDFFGASDCMQMYGVRCFDAGWNMIRRITGDVFPIGSTNAANAANATFAGAVAGDYSQYLNIHDNIYYSSADDASAYGFNLVSLTGTTAAGSTTVTGVADTSQLQGKMAVIGDNIPNQTTIASVTANAFTLSSATGVVSGTGAIRASTGSSNEPHGDFIQIRPLLDYSQGADMYWLVENNTAMVSLSTYTRDQSDTSRDKLARVSNGRQFCIDSSGDRLTYVRRYSVFLNNISATANTLGIGLGLGESFCEYNSLIGQSRMPPSGTGSLASSSATLRSAQGFKTAGNRSGRHHVRKNIHDVTTYPTIGAVSGYGAEDNVPVNFASSTGPSPGIALTGPFYTDKVVDTGAGATADESTVTGRIIYDVADVFVNTPSQTRKSAWSALKPIGDAGAQSMAIRLNPGDVDTLTQAQAATLAAVTDVQPVGVGVGTASLRWNSGPGETGVQAGTDVTLNVQ